ncbi:DUF86 domain-containing protein [Patescibacteria group bacterium]|nr:DUF86 domain-containing protein [Patescibacteria group bacterium]
MKKEPIVFLTHIMECIELIEDYTKGVKKAAFDDDIKLQDAIIRRIEIIGEASKNIPLQTKKRYTQVDWRKMSGMRDVLIHQYYGVRLDDAWDTVQNSIPQLKKQIQKIIAELQKK